jgi:hypothetical protein
MPKKQNKDARQKTVPNENEVLRRMLNTSPKPQKKIKIKKPGE